MHIYGQEVALLVEVDGAWHEVPGGLRYALTSCDSEPFVDVGRVCDRISDIRVKSVPPRKFKVVK